MAWGNAKSNLKVETIKELQKRVAALNEAETTEENRAAYLEECKIMDELLKKEIYLAQRSRIPWLNMGIKIQKIKKYITPKQPNGGGKITSLE